MEELNKIYRVIRREIPDAPHEVLLVLDATTGQNALSQAQAVRGKSGSNRSCVDETGRNGQRRHRHRHPQGVGHSG